MINLKSFRDTAEGLPDILNYAACIEPGIFLNKDGSLTSAFEYRAPDVFSATNLDKNVMAKRINSLLTKLGDGWCLHIDSIRKPIKEYALKHETYFNNSVTAVIDEERRDFFLHQGQQFETVNVITLTYLPPNKNKSKISDFMFDDDEKKNKKSNLGTKILKEFKSKIEEFLNLSSSVVIIKPLLPSVKMDSNDNEYYEDRFLQYVNTCIIGKYHPINLPKVAMFLDTYIGAYDFYTGVYPKIDNKYIGVVAIEGFPSESYPNILNDLNSLPIEYRWNTRYIFMEQHEAKSRLEHQQKKWKQKQKGLIAQVFFPNSREVDAYAKAMTDEIGSAIAEVNSGIVNYGYYSSNIILMDESRENLEHNIKEVMRIIENNGFSTRLESINAVEAWLGTLPGSTYPNIRNILINSFNLSHLMPLSSIWVGDKYNPSDKYPKNSPALIYSVSEGSSPFRLNLHVGDVGHTLIFGPTGSGKSTLLALIAASHSKYRNSQLFAFDKGNSLYPLTKAAKGLHFDIGGENNELSFAPLKNLKTKHSQQWAESWILTLVRLQGVNPTPKQKQLLHEALLIHIDTNSSSLTEFISNVQDEELTSALNHYSIDGSMGHLLDAEEDNLSLSDLVTFEIESLMNLNDEDAIPVLDYLFFRIEASLDGRPSMLILDEAWLMLGHPVFKEKIKEWLKVFRKANCNVVLATQSLSDASNSGILDVLMENCPSKIFLPNPNAWNMGTSNSFGPYDFYKLFNLNDREIEIIADAIPKREYYYCSPLGTRLFNLVLGSFTLSIVGKSSKEDIKEIKSLIKNYGSNSWLKHWLQNNKVDSKYIDSYERMENESY